LRTRSRSTSAATSARALHLGAHALCANQQPAAVLGQQHSTRAALEELDAEYVLQLVDRARHGRLRPEQRDAGAVRAALVGDREERSKLAQLGLHAGSAQSKPSGKSSQPAPDLPTADKNFR
jgi:hypothetical protein